LKRRDKSEKRKNGESKEIHFINKLNYACIITVYLELAKSQKGKKTILLPLFFAFFVLSSVTPLVEAGRIYQGHGSTTYIYPVGEAWAMVDTNNHKLSLKWSFPSYIVSPWPGIWTGGMPYGYIEIKDSNGLVYQRWAMEEKLPNEGEIWLDYYGENTWITFHIVGCYQLASPSLAWLNPDITISFYVGNDCGCHGGGGGQFPITGGRIY